MKNKNGRECQQGKDSRLRTPLLTYTLWPASQSFKHRFQIFLKNLTIGFLSL